MQDRGPIWKVDAMSRGQIVDANLRLGWLQRPGKMVDMADRETSAAWA